ncbi:hypothetical protein A2716_01950 [candidate division WWE3 bacterium RIFCSPHIGHO2_01_FULL_40_23]|uniref:Ribulose-phosphate 3-epimerase n=1 Tax=candidate division WWE3 bacterium RIFCSPLOWO2_01_FULL_41_18 TaxID=1802625 RepID=A0A1F4VGC0_UNCKA|nr:MAG: hypothetical protein A2716_01950 [candidate division WWE3 bacterium RIFCSPHIGHO2_01_FULL_40_23]OGC55753.1 MAG: hypothetical protein A3A78_01800 [candidate division WWE3 bacterium RIFCSPLOWO2_01_FULL_41_18]
MNEIKIVPGILEKDLNVIIEKIHRFEGFAKSVQVDVIDGKFAPNTTFMDIRQLEKINTSLKIELDLHVENPQVFIPFGSETINKVILHVESANFSRGDLEELHMRDFEAGISLSPETEISEIEPFLGLVDCVQFMTVVPGFSNQTFLPEVLPRIKEFHINFPDMVIEVDGGINPKTAKLAIDAGATILSSTSFLGECDNLAECISELGGQNYGN